MEEGIIIINKHFSYIFLPNVVVVFIVSQSFDCEISLLWVGGEGVHALLVGGYFYA